MMNATNISTPAPTPAPAPAPSSSSPPPMTTTTNLLSNALSIACEIPVEETNIMSFLDLREFLMTACAVVVLLTLLNALQGTLTKSFAAKACAAGSRTIVGPFPVKAYNDSDGHVNITYSATPTTMKVAAVKIL